MVFKATSLTRAQDIVIQCLPWFSNILSGRIFDSSCTPEGVSDVAMGQVARGRDEGVLLEHPFTTRTKPNLPTLCQLYKSTVRVNLLLTVGNFARLYPFQLIPEESIRAERVGTATDSDGNGRKSVGLFEVFSWNPY